MTTMTAQEERKKEKDNYIKDCEMNIAICEQNIRKNKEAIKLVKSTDIDKLLEEK